MKKALALMVTAVALGFASPSFAEGAKGKAEKASSETCDSLLKQVDEAIAQEKKSPKHADAEKKRSEGAQACAEGKRDEGIKTLHAALKDLRAKSAMKGSSSRTGY